MIKIYIYILSKNLKKGFDSFLPHLGCLFRQKVIKYMNIFLEYKWFPDRCDKPLHFNLIFVNVGCEDSFLYLSICWLYDRYTSYLSPETLWRNKPLEIHAKILHYTAIVKNKTFLYKNVTKNYLTLAHRECETDRCFCRGR